MSEYKDFTNFHYQHGKTTCEPNGDTHKSYAIKHMLYESNCPQCDEIHDAKNGCEWCIQREELLK